MRKREKGRNYINKQRHANLFLNRRNRLHTIISKIKLLDLGYGSEENHDKQQITCQKNSTDFGNSLLKIAVGLGLANFMLGFSLPPTPLQYVVSHAAVFRHVTQALRDIPKNSCVGDQHPGILIFPKKNSFSGEKSMKRDYFTSLMCVKWG